MATRTDMTPGLGLKKAVMSSEKRPETLPPLVDGLPESLRERPVWLNWRLQYKEGQGWTKVPLNPHTLKPASVTDPAALSTLAVALANIRTGEIDGVGVVLGPAKLVGFDLDDCRNPENEELIPWVKDLIRRLNTYAEVSPSGTGVKLLVIATKPGERCKAGNVEVYSDGRYFTLTGQRVPDTPAEPQPRQEAVNAVYAELFPSASQPSRPAGSTPAVLSPGDEALLAKAFAAKNGDKLKRLWNGDRTGYASESEADLALCSGLAFWYPTPDRIDAAFRRSKLYRPKWERADYRRRTLAKALEGRTEFYSPPTEETASPDDRPEIIVTADEYCTNDAAAEALGRLPDVYVRGNSLVHVIEQGDGTPVCAGLRRPDGGMVIRELLPPLLSDKLTRAAVFVKRKVVNGKVRMVQTGPPRSCVGAVHTRGSWPSVATLLGVIVHPVLLSDGSLLLTRGYHRPSGLLVNMPVGLKLSVPDRPTRKEVETARDMLLDLVSDFPFASAAHQAAWLAGLLTPFCRYAFEGPAPLFLNDANLPGTGKGLSVDVVALIALGRRFPVMAYTSNAEELRKRITTLAVEGDTMALIDNVTGPFGDGALDAALTATRWKERLLGTNRQCDVPLLATWYATGNNCELRGDIGRRICHIRLETPEEQPELRAGFRHPHLREHVRQNRSRLLSAVLTILRGWVVAGRPPATGAPNWGSFEGWSAVVRSCVIWLGQPDPGETRQTLVAQADRNKTFATALLRQLLRIDPRGDGRSASQIITLSERDADLRAVLQENLRHLNPQALGFKFRSLRNCNYGGYFLEPVRTDSHGAYWAVRSATEFHRRSDTVGGTDLPEAG